MTLGLDEQFLTSEQSQSEDGVYVPRPDQADPLPKRTGRVELTQDIKGRRVKVTVVLKVYCSTFGRYAVVAQDRLPLVKDCGFINLRSCSIVRTESGFKIIPADSERLPLEFRIIEGDGEAWYSVLDPHCEDAILQESTTCTVSSAIDIPRDISHVRDRSRSPLSRPFPARGSPGSTALRHPGLPSLSEDDGEEV